MSKQKSTGFLHLLFSQLGWPLVWGSCGTLAFYSLIRLQIVQNEMVVRYFAGHPVEYVETWLFFVGMAALAIKIASLASQFRVAHESLLPPVQEAGEPLSQVASLTTHLDEFPQKVRSSYLWQRLRNALRFLHRGGAVEDLDEQLRYLSDIDAEKSHEGYGLVRMIVWATPMLGFLGTVIGITLALGDLSPEALINAPQEAMQGLLSGLSIAFDTTALALSLSIVLMFAQYVVRQTEIELLSSIDRRAESDLVGRFQRIGAKSDPHVASIKAMSEQVVTSVESMVASQSHHWEAAMSSTEQRWSSALQNTGTNIQEQFTGAMQSSLVAHAEAMRDAEITAGERIAVRWEQLQRSVQEQSAALAEQQTELHRQSDILLRVLEATGEVSHLERSLNRNLAALAGAKNFEDTVMSLSAAIQLLCSRLGTSSRDYRLQDTREEGKAA